MRQNMAQIPNCQLCIGGGASPDARSTADRDVLPRMMDWPDSSRLIDTAASICSLRCVSVMLCRAVHSAIIYDRYDRSPE